MKFHREETVGLREAVRERGGKDKANGKHTGQQRKEGEKSGGLKS